MEKETKPKLTITGKIEKIWGPILGFIVAVIGLPIAIIELIERYDKTISIILISISGVIIITILLYVYLRKKTLEIYKKEEESNKIVWYYPAKTRIAAVITLILILAGSITAGATYYHNRQRKMIVVIASFDGPEEVYGVRNEMMDNLINQFREDDEIIIQGIDEVITPDEGSEIAREIGKQTLADIIIWGWYRPAENTNMTINVEYLKDFNNHISYQKQTLKPTVMIDELESFTFQKTIGKETKGFIQFVSSLIAYKNNDYEKAIEKAQMYLETTEDTDIFQNRSNGIAIITYSANMEKDNDKVIEYASKGIEECCNTSDFYNLRGVAYANKKEWEKAKQDLEKAIELSQNYIAYYNMASVFEVKDEYEKAIELYTTSIEKNPYDAETYIRRGFCYYKLENYVNAMRDVEKAIELDRSNPESYYLKGMIQIETGECRDSIKNLNKALRMYPEEEKSYKYRGLAYECLEKHQKAIRDFSKAIRIRPEDPDPYFFRGQIKVEQNFDIQGAIEDLEIANKLKPDDPVCLGYLGRAYYRNNEHEQSIEYYSYAIELDPELPDFYWERGIAYFDDEKYEKAVENFNEAIELDFQEPENFYYYRGIAYDKIGEFLKSRLDLAKFEELTGIKVTKIE